MASSLQVGGFTLPNVTLLLTGKWLYLCFSLLIEEHAGLGSSDDNATDMEEYRWFGSLVVSTTLDDLLEVISIPAPDLIDMVVQFKVDFDVVC